MKRIVRVLLIFVFIFLIIPFNSHDRIAYGEFATLNPEVDTGMDSLSGAFDNAASTRLYVGYESGYMDQAALRFNLSSISGDMTDAELSIYVGEFYSGTTTTFNLYGSTDDSWLETVMPLGDGGTIGTYSVTEMGWITIDVTDYIRNKISDGKATFVLKPTVDCEAFFGFYSREETEAVRPKLNITYTPNTPPTVTDSFYNTIVYSNINFTQTDFTNRFTDTDGDSLRKIQITSLPDPTFGTLWMNGSEVALNQEIQFSDLYNLVFVSNNPGTTSFTWKGHDGTDYSSSDATATLVIDAPDSDGNLTAAGGVSEPMGLATTVDTVGEAVDIFDFTLSDGSSGDGLSMDVSQIVVHVEGTTSDTVRDQITYRLNGNDASNIIGTYNSGSDTITFAGLNISIANGGNETYTINGYYNSNTGLREDDTIKLSIDGDTDVTVLPSGTQMATTSPVTNGSGSTINVTATGLDFTTQPTGSTSGSALSIQPVVGATDSFGNTDVDFTETITLTESSGGSLSGDVDVAAVNGVATFTNVAYTATADQESFILTANDEDGTGSNLGTEDSNSVTSDVVATKLIFSTEPDPKTIVSGEATSLTTVPSVKAVDANDTLDTGYSTDIQLAVVNGLGSATLNGTGDTDGSGVTVSITPSSGIATFTNLTVNYTASGEVDETFNLQASSGGLTTANSTQITALYNEPPIFDEGETYTLPIIDENTSNDTTIGILGVTDGDSGDTLTFNIAGGNIGHAFRLSTLSETSNGGRIPFDIIVNDNSGLDYETRTSYSLIIEVSDGIKKDTITVTINLNNLNDNSPIMNSMSMPIQENSPNGMPVGPIMAMDPDGDILTYSITGGNSDGVFAIDSNTGLITINDNTNLDYEATTRYVLTIGCSDGIHNIEASAIIHVNNINDNPPVIDNRTISIDENSLNGTIVGSLTGSDPDGDSLTYSIIGGNESGTFNINNSTGQITVADTTQLDYESITSYTLIIEADDSIHTDTATVTININNLNDNPPTITSIDNITLVEDNSTGTIAFTIGDIDTVLANLTVTAISSNEAIIPNANIVLAGTDGNRTVEVTPEANQNGTVTITITVSDGELESNEDFILTVTSVNDAPILTSVSPLLTPTNEDTVSLRETVGSLVNGTINDPDNGALEGIAVTSHMGNGTWQYSLDNGGTWTSIGTVSNPHALLLDANAKLRYVSDGMNGETATLTYRAWDLTSGSPGSRADTTTNGGTTAFSTSSDTASITVTSVNDAPILDSSSTPTLTSITEDDIDNGGQTIASIIGTAISDIDTGAAEGMAIISTDSGNGVWEYSTDSGGTWTPVETVTDTSTLLLRDTDKIRFVPNSISGTTATITFRGWDQTSGSPGNKVDTTTNGGTTAFSTSSDTASITVASVNDAPVTNDDSYSVEEDTTLTIDVTLGVLSNDSDIEGDSLSAVLVSDASNGTMTLNGDGSFTYTSNEDFNGTDSFSYKANDGLINSDSATITITVNPVNDVPVTNDDSATTREGIEVTIDVLSNDSDIDGDTLTTIGVIQGSNGTVTINGDNTLTYTPNRGFIGDDTFNYTISDGNGGEANGGVSITVRRKPVIVNNDNESTGLQEMLVNGEAGEGATAQISEEDGQRTIAVTVDDEQLQQRLGEEDNNSIITLPVSGDFDTISGELNGQTVKSMEEKEAVLEIKTDNVVYTLPASQMNIDYISEKIGENVEPKDIRVKIEIANPSEDTVRVVEDTADAGNYTLVVNPIEFNITCTYGEQTVEVSRFNNYVERMVRIPEGVDPEKITTGVVLNSDGSFSHVPTTIVEIEGVYYARINSLTNSVYTVVYSPKSFKDVESHWSKEAVNDMASRLVINGIDGLFKPDQDITRGEFVTIMVKALGLTQNREGKEDFKDVEKTAWYYKSVSIAEAYKLISGDNNNLFKPLDEITREEAMVIISRAMKLTGTNQSISNEEGLNILEGYKDSHQISSWSKEGIIRCIQEGLIEGYDNSLKVKDNISRGETATIVRRLLKAAGLI